MRLAHAIWLLCLLPLLATAEGASLRLALREAEGNRLYTLTEAGVSRASALPEETASPLGSIWKLYVYAWLEDTHQTEQPYQCQGHDPEEVYCCHPGESITRDTALVRSCGLYFAPSRLHIDESAWDAYWRQHNAPSWVSSLSSLGPQTQVSVKALLDSLAVLPAQQKARNVLLDVMLDNSKEGVAAQLGGRLRVKTWSWFASDKAYSREGGFAGWLTDGTPVWAGGSGTSKTVLTRYAAVLNQLLPVPSDVASGQCVLVDMFARYPVQSVIKENTTQSVTAGPLFGRYRVTFSNGNHLTLVSSGETLLLTENGTLRLQAHLDREEYVARVLDREAASTPLEAAKAMTIVIRTWLLQNAQREGECLRIGDSSASQRVSPSPASHAAREVTAWTQDMILAGGPVNYHRERAATGLLSWQNAREQAAQGERFDAILSAAFPYASLSRWDDPHSTCQPMPEAKRWLVTKRAQWRRQLDLEPGYSEPSNFAVCKLVSGFPFTDRQQKRLYIRNFFTLQDRLDVTHEYLHLAFDGYPSGLDESYVENLARHLLMD
ncbi:MAG: DUF2300 domain-containing protein [Enterobacteriaceae bacterium]|nr:DUF2300 domain-containing protein [Enterobacteriaceae bacterium]